MVQVLRSLVSAPQSQVASSDSSSGLVADLRFRMLVGETAWGELPEAVQRRFSKTLAPGDAALYRGRVVATELSRFGRVLAFLGRAIGSPLPDTDGATGAAVVSVVAEPLCQAQIWTRTYMRPGRFPQVVHSMKRFRGATGLEEYVGSGIGMALRVTVEDRALVFRSAFYFLEAGRFKVRLPGFLTPGQMTITHRDLGGEFRFDLELRHPRFGVLIRQNAVFQDAG